MCAEPKVARGPLNVKHLRGAFLAVTIAVYLTSSVLAAEEGSIDRLLKKLPPPEKVVKRQAPAGVDLAQIDPAFGDPIGKKAVDAINAQKYSRALGLLRDVARKYPRSVLVHGLRGSLALNLHKFREASEAFQNAVNLDPKFAIAHFGLAASEAEQGHFGSALQHFQLFARLEPKVEIAWIASSECAERLGRLREGRDYAARATTVAPKSVTAWLQLARTEAALGNTAAAKKAIARAQQLGATKKSTTARR